MSSRERERDACDVIDITLKSRVIMHVITSTARWPYAYAYASTRSEPAAAVECSKCMTSQTTNSNSCDRAVAQVKYRSTYPNNPGEWTASTEEISKKGIKLILKTIGNRNGDCAWSCSRWQTQPEKSANCKAQISRMCGVNDTDLCVAICRFSQVVFVTSNNFTHNLLFYFQ